MTSGVTLSKRILLPAIILAALAAALVLRGDATAAGPGVVELVSPGGDYSAIAISADSLYVAFERQVIERKTGRTVARAPGGGAYNPLDLSADSNVFAFVSNEPIVPEDTNDCGGPGFPASCQDVYVYDRAKDLYELVSVASDGTPGDNHSGWYDDIAISGDGRQVAFVSFATNLVPDGLGDGIFVRDRLLATTARVLGTGSGAGGLLAVNMSADGRFITYDAYGPDAVGVYLYDRDSDGNGTYDEPGGTSTKRVSDGSYPVISDDGSALAFYEADRIVYYDVLANTKTSVAAGSFFAGTGMDLGKDGRYLAFATDEPIAFNDDNGVSDVYLYDHRSPLLSPLRPIELLSRQQGGPVGDGWSAWGFPLEHLATIALTPDARFAAFYTGASNLGGPGVVLAGTSVLGRLDTDLDGCTDKQEVGPRPELGGGRNPNNFWDFFDTPPRDQVVSIKDIGAVVRRFGSIGDPTGDPLAPPPPAPAYHTGFDRTASAVKLSGPPNGSITIQDIVLVVGQYGHSCAPVPVVTPLP